MPQLKIHKLRRPPLNEEVGALRILQRVVQFIIVLEIGYRYKLLSGLPPTPGKNIF